MALVEAVTSELEDHVPEVLSFFLGKPFLHAPLQELFRVGSDQLFLLLADRLDAGVGFGQLNPSEPVENPHDLFLIDHDPVGFFQNLLENRVDVGRFLFLQFDGDIFVDHPTFERSRSVEGVGCDDVVESVWLHPLEKIPNPTRLQLKHSLRFTALQELESLSIVEREIEWIDPNPARLLDDVDRLGKDRQVSEPEEVHLQEPGRFDVSHRPLGDDVFLTGDSHQRDILGEWFIGDHHGGGVGTDVSRHPLDAHCEIEKLSYLGVGIVESLQVLAFAQRVLDRDLRIVGNQLGHLRDAVQWEPQRSPHVFDRPPSLEGTEGSDLGDVCFAILLFDVANDLGASFLAEVDIDIGGFETALVEEPLEQQVILDRADVG